MSDWVTLRDALGLTLRPIDQWPGKQRYDRERSPFSAPFKDTLAKLKRELAALSAKSIVLQVAFREEHLRLDGLPRVGAIATHPGVILAFESRHGSLRLVFDGFTKWQDNLRAIAFHLEHLRMAGLYGVGRDGQQYQGWKALPAPAPEKMGPIEAAEFIAANGKHDNDFFSHTASDLVSNTASLAVTYRRAAAKLHPDSGGSHDQFLRLQEAKAVLDKHHKGGDA